MLGKGWISDVSATAMLFSHAEQVREYIHAAIKESQSQAIAFNEGLTEVAEKGTQLALSER